MPTTLTSASNDGRSIDVPTSACAARWKTSLGVCLERAADVVLDEGRRLGEVLASAGAEVVDHDDLVAPREQCVDEVRADEAGPAGDQRAHRGSLLRAAGLTSGRCSSPSRGSTARARRPRPGCSRRGSSARAWTCVLTREPGGTPLGEAVRDLVLHGEHVAPWAEVALYAAARAQHVDQVIRPALERGATVVCDRYVDSSAAYQGGARRLGVDTVLELNLTVVGGLMPDRTVLVEISPETAAARVGGSGDRIERDGVALWARAAEAYRDLAARYRRRYVVVDGTRPVDELAEEIHGHLR